MPSCNVGCVRSITYLFWNFLQCSKNGKKVQWQKPQLAEINCFWCNFFRGSCVLTLVLPSKKNYLCFISNFRAVCILWYIRFISINILTTATCDLGSPIDCKWTEFSLWSECSQSCGGGVQSRERTIEILARNGGQPCRGETREKRQCNTHKCPRTFFLLSQIDFRINTDLYLSLHHHYFVIIVATFRAQDLIFLPFY